MYPTDQQQQQKYRALCVRLVAVSIHHRIKARVHVLHELYDSCTHCRCVSLCSLRTMLCSVCLRKRSRARVFFACYLVFLKRFQISLLMNLVLRKCLWALCALCARSLWRLFVYSVVSCVCSSRFIVRSKIHFCCRMKLFCTARCCLTCWN